MFLEIKRTEHYLKWRGDRFTILNQFIIKLNEKNIDNNTITKIINKIHNTFTKKDCQRYFRGHSDSEFKLLPSVYKNDLLENENNIQRIYFACTQWI